MWNVCIMFEEITRRRVHITMEARGLKLVIVSSLCMFCLQLFKVCAICNKKCAVPKNVTMQVFNFEVFAYLQDSLGIS